MSLRLACVAYAFALSAPIFGESNLCVLYLLLMHRDFSVSACVLCVRWTARATCAHSHWDTLRICQSMEQILYSVVSIRKFEFVVWRLVCQKLERAQDVLFQLKSYRQCVSHCPNLKCFFILLDLEKSFVVQPRNPFGNNNATMECAS